MFYYNPIPDIIKTLRRYPNIRVINKNNLYLKIFRSHESGFDIILEYGSRESTLQLKNFHYHYGQNEIETNSLKETIIKSLFGLARIKEYSNKGKIYKTILQEKCYNWEDIEQNSILHSKFNIEFDVKYYQNTYQYNESGSSKLESMNLSKEINNHQAIVSSQFLALGINNIAEATEWIAQLPYRRNSDKEDILIVLKEACGTCSSKHALLKRLADENDLHVIRLMLGIFEMNAKNTPSINNILTNYKLDNIPEAHNYLKVDEQILDFTGLTTNDEDFSQALLTEIEITPDQITDYKVDFHKQFLQQWIIDKQIPYSLEELWKIREQCIQALSKANLQLETPRLWMRPFEEEDAEKMFALNDDPEVLQYTGDVQFENMDTLRIFLRDYPQYERYHVGRLLLIHKDTHEVLGWSGLKYDEELKEYDIGYRLFKKYWGFGYATESALASLSYGFNSLGISSIVGRSRVENTASIHVFEKLNMKFESAFVEDDQNWVLYRINRIDYLNTIITLI